MKLGVIADDFTGASDIALMLSEGGMPTAQYVGIPGTTADPAIEAGVIGLKTRTVPAQEAITRSLEACDWLKAQGAEQIVLKICSTFDSTDAGNIGPVAEALADWLGETSVLVCPAFPENGRTVFEGHLFVKDRLLSECGMQHHPLTPMTDPDLRRVLARQTSWPVGHIPVSTVWTGPDAICRSAEEAGKAMVIVDAIRNDDLLAIGQAAKSRNLLVGGSGIALGLPENFGFSQHIASWTGVTGKAVVLSGSCSTATRGQVAAYKSIAPSRELAADDIITKRVSLQEILEWTLMQEHAPLLYSSADPSVVAAAQERFGREASAEAIESLFANLAAALSQAGVQRIVVAGGETSGAVVSGLDAHTLEIGPKIAAGVPALKVSGRPLALALKSGNFGGPDFFQEALAVLEGSA
ncbi:MAG: four-carbon acid sugar kinase family protein [Roseibium sp.]|uniref:3-oxo-tetronate kinase n=1 Tax=Roseibium sp. TaxID=1936156 RepID=UPI00262FC2EF|nr:3-oxo-tetronate kinase [Roseibium sp.]MCV0424947.1 four-carbon acid sugar kinase family protein [Roseibium sp.]